MVRDQQVRIFRLKLMQGKTQEPAAAAAGISARSARTWQRGPLPPDRNVQRSWRTWSDPFAPFWSEAIKPLLQRDLEGALEATTVLKRLEERYTRYSSSPIQLGTLHCWHRLVE